MNELGQFYQQKRDTFREFIKQSQFKLLPSQGTYFQLADYSAISEKSDVDFCKELITNHGVAAIPVSVFREDKKQQQLVRFCFAKDDNTLEQAAERLCKI